MLISRRKFKRSMTGTLRRLKWWIEDTLELHDFGPITGLIYAVLALLVIVGIVFGFYNVFKLLAVSKALILPLGVSWSHAV